MVICAIYSGEGDEKKHLFKARQRTEKQLEAAKTQERNMRLPQKAMSLSSSIFFSSDGSYFLPNKSD